VNKISLLFFLVIAAIFSQPVFAQTAWCVSAEQHKRLLQQYPSLVEKQNQLEQLYQQYLSAAQKGQRAVITIPVVVHAVHDGDTVGGSENISDAQVLSQIDALNIDYRKMNPDTANIPSVFKPLAADFEIEFCLAARDPDGNATNGIERINGQRTSWTIATADEFKPSTIWDPSKYLNIWVMRLGGTNSSTLGYAQFPGMPDSTDGIVVDYKAFGIIGDLLSGHDEGKTLTHEVGHWLGLIHVWGDDNGACNQDDLISDTPVQRAENYGCPTFPHLSCSNGPNGDMFMNYMDYVNDDCSFMFTTGQKARADFFLTGERASILTSIGCEPAPVYERDMAILELLFPTEEICTNVFTPYARVKNQGTVIITSMLINYQVDGVGLNQYLWQGWIDPGSEYSIHFTQQSLPLGTHSYYVYLSGLNGAVDQNVGNEDAFVNFEIVSIGIGESIPAEEGFEAGAIPNLWELENPNSDRAWKIDTSAGADGSSVSAMFDNFSGNTGSNPRGTRDGLITPKYDFRNANIPFVTLSVAYARRTSTSKDSLLLYSSLDCGYSWQRIWSKTNSALATAPDKATKFVPAETEWREELIWLNDLAGQGKVQFKFENYSDWGNNIYMDDFKVNLTPAGVGNTPASNLQLEVYPNPTDGNFSVRILSAKESDYRIEIFTMEGRKSLEFYFENKKSENIELNGIPKGLYLLRCSGKNTIAYKKLLIQ